MTQVQIDAEALLIIMEYAYLGEHRNGGNCRHELVVGCPLCDSFVAGLRALEDAGHEHRPDLDWWSNRMDEITENQFGAALAHVEGVEVVGPVEPQELLTGDEYFKRHPYRTELVERAESMDKGRHCASCDGHSCPDVE